MKKQLITITVLVLLSGLYFIVHKSPKCPDDYATAEESTEAMNVWTNAFFDENPEASIKDWGDARLDYYHQNNCTEAIERRERYESGDVSEEELESINSALESFIQ